MQREVQSDGTGIHSSPGASKITATFYYQEIWVYQPHACLINALQS